MAPEILANKPYQGHVADIFSLGVILFVMYTGHPPFERANKDDSYYQYICLNRFDLFWKKHEKYHDEGFFTNDFKDLISNMLQPSPFLRLSLVDIIGHDWLSNGETATKIQAVREMARRN